MCSTPQKQPAAIVAFSAPSGRAIVVEPPASGVRRMVLVVNGRVNRWKIDAMVGSVITEMRKIRNFVRGFRLNEIDSARIVSGRYMYVSGI
jgi:hypothetical protein